MLRSSRPRPTTARPMTAPLEKATLSPPFRLFFAAVVVLAFEFVATVMPMKPAKPEKNPPVRNANGVNIVRYPSQARTRSTTNIAPKNTATPVY